MKVGSVNLQNRNNISFCGQRLFSAKLIDKVTKQKLDCFISQMDESDLTLVKKTLEKWKVTKYGPTIFNDFIDSFKWKKFVPAKDLVEYKFFMVEDPKAKLVSDRIKAIAEISSYYNAYFLNYIQSATEICDTANKYKGAGESLLYAIANIAGNTLKRAVICAPDPTATDFYKKNFFKNDLVRSASSWLLNASDFSNIQSRLKSKYSIEPLNLKC